MPELVDEGACLSDSTSEEHSLSSYTSESFDDNGKTHLHLSLRVLTPFPLPVSVVVCYVQQLKVLEKQEIVGAAWRQVNGVVFLSLSFTLVFLSNQLNSVQDR